MSRPSKSGFLSALLTGIALLIGSVSAPLSAATTTQWVAGGGLGDGSPATAVSVLPRAVLSAGDGSLYIADELFNRIRRVGTDGRIESVVGNGGYGFGQDGLPGLAAQLGIVEDLALDPAGRLFFIDLGHGSLRFIDADGAIQTFATPQAPLFASVPGRFAPVSLAIDGQGRIHVADRGTNVVWQIDADGQGRRAGGNGERGYSGDGGRSALARLADPRAVAVGAGSIWIADTGNRRVRLITPEGLIHTVAGDGTEDHPATLSTAAAGALQMSLKPIDLQVDAEGTLYILDDLGQQLLRLDGVDPDASEPAAHATLTVVGRFAADTKAVALSIDPDGAPIVADYTGRRVLRLDPEALDPAASPILLAGNGTVRAAGDGSDARNASLYRPTASAVTRSGQTYFVDSGNGLLRLIDADGLISTVEIDPSWSVTQPTGVAVDGDGGLYVAAREPAQILYRDEGGRWERILTHDQIREPVAVTMDLSGRLLVVDAGRRWVARVIDGRLQPIAGNGDVLPVGDGGPATQTALLRPVDVAVEPDGIWIVDAGAHSLYRLGTDGLLRHWAGTGAAGAGVHGAQAHTAALNSPSSVASDGMGGAYVADAGNKRLVHVDANGVLNVLGDVDDIQRPVGLTRLSTGELLVSDDLAHRLLRLRHDIEVAPLAQRLRQADPTMTTRVVGALNVTGAQQILAIGSSTAPQILVRHDEGVVLVRRDGTQKTLLADNPGGPLAAVVVRELGSVVARVSSARLGRSKPVALIRTDAGVADQTFDLDDYFSGAEAIAADEGGHLYFYQSDGTILRLAGTGLGNIPGHDGSVGQRQVGQGSLQVWARSTPDPIALATTGTGIIATAAANGDIWWLRDRDADGVSDERQLLARLPQRPTSLAILDGQVYAGTADRLYRVGLDGVDLVAAGFAPRLLSLASMGGTLLALEGSATAARVLEIASATHHLQAWPQVIDFGAAGRGVSVVRDVVLRNDGSRSVRLLAPADARTDGFDVAEGQPGSTIQILPGGSHRLQIVRNVEEAGTVHDEVILRSEAGAELLRVPISIHGLAPRLQVDPVVDFGLAWVGAAARRTVELMNEGDAPLVVEQITVDGSSQFALPTALQLPIHLEPGQSTSLAVTFKPLAGADYETELQLHTNDPDRPRRHLRLQGQGGRALLDFGGIGDELDLGSVVVGAGKRHRLVLRNDGEMDLRVGQIVAGTQRLVITPRQLVVPAGGEAHLLVDFRPLVHGPLQGTLRLITDDPSRPQRLLTYRGFGVTREIELSTRRIDFGPRPWGQTSRLQIQITNHRQARLQLSSIRTNHRQFRVLTRPASIEPGGTGTVTIGYVPSEEGAVDGLLTMTTNAPEAPILTVPLQGRGQTLAEALLQIPGEPQDLWPEGIVEVPLVLRGARGLRGLVVELSDVPSPLYFKGVRLPATSMLHAGDAPLLIESRGPDGQLRIGLSVAGEGVGVGDGTVAILQFGLEDGALDLPLPRLEATLAVRSSAGAADTTDVVIQGWPTITRRGDLDGDGSLGLDDVFLLLEALDGRSNITLKRYDLDGDGQLGRSDFDELLKHLHSRAAARAVALLEGLPGQVGLAPPHPNPFNAETVLTVELPQETVARVEIHNSLGQRIRTLLSSSMPAGRHRVQWDGQDGEGQPVRTGVYFVSLVTPNTRHVHRLLLLR